MSTYSVTEAFVARLAQLGYAVSTRPPEQAPQGGEFVTVERVGGGVADWLDRPSMAVQCWAATEERAEEMANEVRLALLDNPPLGVLHLAVDSGPYPFWDEGTGLPRYQTTFNCTAQLTA